MRPRVKISTTCLDARNKSNDHIRASFHSGACDGARRNVGAGDDEHAVSVSASSVVSLYKQTAFQHLLLNHRVAVYRCRRRVLPWATIVVLHRRFAKEARTSSWYHKKPCWMPLGDSQQVGVSISVVVQQALVCAKDLVFPLFRFGSNAKNPPVISATDKELSVWLL